MFEQASMFFSKCSKLFYNRVEIEKSLIIMSIKLYQIQVSKKANHQAHYEAHSIFEYKYFHKLNMDHILDTQ